MEIEDSVGQGVVGIALDGEVLELFELSELDGDLRDLVEIHGELSVL